MCKEPQGPLVLIVLRVQPLGLTPQRAVSSPVWSFADWTWSWGRLRCLWAISLVIPLLSTVIEIPSLFTWVSLGIFFRLFKNGSYSHCKGFRHNRLSEPVVTDYLQTYLVHQFSLVQCSLSLRSDSLRPHELQHARPPCPSPTPGVHSNSCLSSR